MGIDCYYNPMSSPSRAVLLTAKNLGIPMNLKLVNLNAGDQYKPEFLKMNPQHSVPTLDDNGFYLYESRAVMQYLANSYGKNDSLYPKDPKKRFLVDQRLMFDQGTLYQSFNNAYLGAVLKKQKIEQDNLNKLNEALDLLNAFVSETTFAAGNSLTIADFTIMATLCTIDAAGHDVTTDHPAIKSYMDICKQDIKGFTELCQQGADQFGIFIRSSLQSQ